MSQINQPQVALDKTAREDASLLPPVDVIEDANGITLLADLPGVSREHLRIHVEGATLTIEGDVVLPHSQQLESSYAEIDVPRFRRVFTLSKEMDGGQVHAEFQHGVLSLRIPKAEHAQPRRIPIAVH